MLDFVWLKILIYGLAVVEITPFLVEKRTKVLDHAVKAPITTTSSDAKLLIGGDANANSQIKKETIAKNLSESTVVGQTKSAIPPKNPSDVSTAVSKLDELEKLLQVYPQNFIDHRETIKTQIQSNINENEKDYQRLQQKLGSLEDTSSTSVSKILQWMKIKKKEINLYKEDLKLIDDISSIVTKLEAAKFISLNNLNTQNYNDFVYQSAAPVDSTYSTTNYYPYYAQYDNPSNWNYLYNSNSNNNNNNKIVGGYYQKSTDYSPTYYANEKSKYDTFNKVFNKYLSSYNGIPIYNYINGASPTKRFSFATSSTKTGYSQPTKLPSSNSAIVDSRNLHYNIYYPQAFSTNTKTGSVDYAKAFTKSNVIEDTSPKTEIPYKDTEKAVNAINYLQNKLGLDTMAVLNLMSQLKETTRTEMNRHKQQLQNNLLEYKRSSINHPSDTVDKRSLIASNQKAFIESRDKYWLIKQVEWFITRLEVAKYAAMSKIAI